MKLSHLADNITTSPILTFAASVNAKIAAGENVYNLTVGDFNPHTYPIPAALKSAIKQAIDDNHTNYPGAVGMPKLRSGVAGLIDKYCGVQIDENDILIASGSRPLIYATFKTLVDKGDNVLFPVPSWNNDYYTTLSEGSAITIETTAENNFMPTKEELLPHIQDATLLALCSPQNPTGTVLSKEQLSDICEVVIAENKRRESLGSNEKPLFVMFDQVYWLMAFNEDVFHHALSVNSEMQKYGIFIDGLSKSFAGTGIRVGWATGPQEIIAKMRAFVAHIGAWAPKAEQVASGEYLQNLDDVSDFITEFNSNLQEILDRLYNGFIDMKNAGLPVDSIKPEASIYLSIKMDLVGKTTKDGVVLNDVDAVQEFLLNEAKVAILPFAWFGAKNNDNWYRISIGTCPPNATGDILSNIQNAILSLD
jgi:aspartate aminotransferase